MFGSVEKFWVGTYSGARVICLTILVYAGYGGAKDEVFLANGVLRSLCQCNECGLGEGDGCWWKGESLDLGGRPRLLVVYFSWGYASQPKL